MATKLYFHAASSGVSGTLPSAEQSSLTVTSGMNFEGSQTTNRTMNTTIGTTQTTLAFTGALSLSARNYYVTRFVSEPISQSGIAANTWTYAFSASESNSACEFPVASSNKAVRVNCYVWRPSNGTKVGTILDGNTAATVDEQTPQIAYHIVNFTGAAVASAAAGDVIIFEVWFIITSATPTSQTLTFYYDGTTEYAENGTSTSAASYISTPENLVFGGAPNNVVRAVPTETVSISEVAFERLAAKIRTRTDTAIVIGESRARLSAKMRPLTTQTTILSENIVRIKGKVKSLTTETITVTGGTLARLLAKIRTRTGSETVVLTDNRARLAAKNRALATQTTTVGAGTLAEIKGAVKTIPQTVIMGENLARLGTKLRALAAQNTTVSAGTAARLKASFRSLALQTVAIGENLARIKGILRSIATQTITVGAGSIARLSTKMRAISQTIVIAEDLQRTLIEGAQNIVKTITQTVTLGESISRLKASQRLTSQTIIVGAGTIARLTAKIRAVSQTIILTDNRTRLSTKLRALATQTVIIADNRARIKGAIKTISQTIVLTENRARLAAKTRILAAQTVALADSVVRQIIGGPVEIIRALSQTVVLSEIVSRRLAVQRILTQTVPIAENLVRVREVLRTLSQSIPLSESRSRIKSASRLLSQTTLSSDSITRLNALTRNLTQTTIIAENVVAETVGNLVRSIVEIITVSDSIARRTAKLVILDQFIVIAEQAFRISTKLRTIPAQTITLSDSITQELNVIIKHAIRVASDIIAITDYAKIEVVKKSQRFRKILQPSIKRLISNHPAWMLGTRGMHNDYEEFSP